MKTLLSINKKQSLFKRDRFLYANLSNVSVLLKKYIVLSVFMCLSLPGFSQNSLSSIGCSNPGPNLVPNPGFELGNTGFQTSYNFVEGCVGATSIFVPEAGEYLVGSNPIDCHANFKDIGDNTTGNGLMLIINGNQVDPQFPSFYEQTITNITPDNYYSFSVFVQNPVRPEIGGADPLAELFINDVSVSAQLLITESQPWVQISGFWFSGNANTAVLEIRTASNASFGNDILIDDVEFRVCGPRVIIDSDGDGVLDDADQCEGFSDSVNTDGDAFADGCDTDDDGDGLLDTTEGLNCSEGLSVNTLGDFTAAGTISNLYPHNGVTVNLTTQVLDGVGPGTTQLTQLVSTTDGIILQGVNADYNASATSREFIRYNFIFSEPVLNPSFVLGGIDNGDLVIVNIGGVGTINGRIGDLQNLSSLRISDNYDDTFRNPLQLFYQIISNNSLAPRINSFTVGSNDLTQNFSNIAVDGIVNRISLTTAKTKQENNVVNTGNVTFNFSNLNYCTIQDTDNDNTPDHLDLDSDNDGCPDENDANPTVASRITFVAASGFPEQTVNTGGEAVFRLDNVVFQSTTNFGSTPNFTGTGFFATSSGLEFAWYIGGDPSNGGVRLTEANDVNNEYVGVNSRTLRINTANSPVSLDGQQFCVVITHPDYGCEDVIQCGVLNVLPPIIDNDENLTTPQNTSLSGDLLSNISANAQNPTITSASVDLNGDGVQDNLPTGVSTIITNASGDPIGTIFVDQSGTFIFDPATNFTGTVPAITYNIVDDNNATDTSILNINVTPVVSNLIDTDGDGIPDITDLDDDNDGVLDTIENAECIVFNEDFGTGTYPGQALATPVTTTHIFRNDIAEFSVFPNALDDNEYVLAVFGNQANGAWQQNIVDHTFDTSDIDPNSPQSPGGFMLAINAEDDPNNAEPIFYNRTNVTLQANSTYQLSSWVINLNSQADQNFCSNEPGGFVLPNVRYEIRDRDNNGAVIASFETGAIPRTGTVWQNFVFEFNSLNTTNVDVVLINNGPGGCGNDLALDDIVLTTVLNPNGTSCGDIDNDGVINSLDIDADNDGIPDNIEAQSTLGYVAPSGNGTGITDVNNNGLDDVYEGVNTLGLTPENTDSTDQPDYLDTDSDNDTILDIAENGNTNNTVSGVDSDNDGLDDNFENGTNNDGPIVNDGLTPGAADLGDEDGDLNNGGDVDYRDIRNPDVIIDDAPEVVEGNDLIFPVRLTNPSDEVITITLTPTVGDPLQVTFQPGETETTVNIPTIDDLIDEPTETITLTVTNTEGPVGDTSDTGSGDVLDNDGPPVVTIENVTVNEDAGTVTVPVTLSNPSSVDTVINIVTTAGTAEDPEDFTTTTTTVTIPAGETSVSVDIPVIEDVIDEADETFTVNGTVTTTNTDNIDPVGTVTIVDNDAAPVVTIENVTVNEGDGTVTVPVTLSNPSDEDTVINIVTTAGTAEDPEDFTTTTTTVTIPAGETSVSVDIPVIEDVIDEADETFTVNGTVTTTNTDNTDPSGTVTIVDNDDTTVVIIMITILDENEVVSTNKDTPISGDLFVNLTDGDSIEHSITDATVDTNGDGTPDTLVLGIPTPITDTAGNPIGEITVNTDGTYTFTPAPDYIGLVPTITYDIVDDNDPTDTDSSTIDITVDFVDSCSSSVDTDGDGLTDCEETTGIDDPTTPGVPTGISDPNNSCDFTGNPAAVVDNAMWQVADCDGDGVTNGDELTPPDGETPTDPNEACSFIPSDIRLTVTSTANCNPNIEVVNVAETSGTRIGDVITYIIRVENTGNIPLTNVTLTETFTDQNGTPLILTTQPTFERTDQGSPEGTLLPGEEATYIATFIINEEAINSGGVISSVLVTGIGTNQETVSDVSDNDDDFDGNVLNDATFTDLDCIEVFNEFSPNGDNVNDTFIIECIGNYPDNTLEVYNRWGNIVYKKQGYNNDWDGTSNGRAVINQSNKLPVGTYYYVLNLNDGSKPKAGWLYINR